MVQLRQTLVLGLCVIWAGVALGQGLPDFASIVEKNSRAVVKISTVTHAKQGHGAGQGMDPYGVPPEQLPEIFRHFFEHRGRPQQREARSVGSGFIISADGYVLTNNHVIEGADEISVRLIDREEYSAEVVGADRRSDIALLKIESKNLPHVKFAKPGQLKVGEWVLAIGSPFGLDYSVSQGIVSAIGRSIPNERNENYVPFIQTDVAINPGNSGGPLFNLSGEVVGINSQIYTRSGGSIGLSFSIPVGLVMDVTEQLKQQGKVARGWLGVGIQDVDKNLAESFGLDKPAGALISYLVPDGPADNAGFEVGDVILAFNGRAVQDSAELPHMVGLTRPGERVPVKVMRNGQQITLKVSVGELDAKQTDDTKTEEKAPEGNRLGLLVEPIDERLKKRWNVSHGVVISRVDPDSASAQARLQRGDVITLLAGQRVESVAGFNRLVENLDSGKKVPMRIIRGGNAGFVAIEVP